MQRRNFIKNTVAAGIGSQFMLGGIPVWAQATHRYSALAEEEDRVLVIVQLFGGNDAANTIIPADDDRYYAVRKTIGLDKNITKRLNDSKSYLHPSLILGKNEGMYGLFKEGQLAVIQGVGYPKPNLSHFRSTDIWLSGTNPDTESELIDSGWLGRLLSNSNETGLADHPPCMNIGNSSSLLFQSGSEDIAISVENPNDFYNSGKDILSGETISEDNTEYGDEKNYFLDLSQKTNKYSAVVKSAFDSGKNSTDYIESEALSQKLKLVSRLISGGLKTKMYLVNIDGFDTHADQGNHYGKHATLLKSVSIAISTFMEDLKKQNLGKKVIGMTVTEFGRRPEQNNSGGTDHGAAGVMFMFGEAVNGKVFGNTLDFGKLDKNKDFIYQYDYRQVYNEVMVKWLKSSETATKQVLGGTFSEINEGLLFVKRELLAQEPKVLNGYSIYPNPSPNGMVNVKFTLTKFSDVTVNEVDSIGNTRSLMPIISLPPGSHDIPLFLQVQKGVYFLQLLIDGKVNVLKGLRV